LQENAFDHKGEHLFLTTARNVRVSLIVGFSLIVAEVLALTLTRHAAAAGWLVDFFFLILTRALLTVAYAWRATKAVSLRRHWILIATGLLLAVIGLSMGAWIFYTSIVLHGSINTVADYSNLVISLGGVPVVILLTLPSSGKPYPKMFFWMDTIQAILWGYIVYLKLFGVIPFTHAELHPASGQTQIIFNVITGAVMIIVGFLRFISATTLDERNFFRFFTVTLFITDVLITLHDIAAGDAQIAGYYELLGTIPVLISLAILLALPKETPEAAIPKPPGRIAEVLNIGCPSLLTLMLMGAGVDAMRHYFQFGLEMVAVAFTLYLVRSVIIQRNLEHSEQSLKAARDRLETLSLTDPLTGVANRRRFEETLAAEWSRAARMQNALSLLITDIDYFKNLNDTQGHQAGDDCIAMVARAFHGCLSRTNDLLARYGGEEFCIILPATDSEGAQLVAVKMREAVYNLMIPNQTSLGSHVSISVGIATCVSPADCTAHELLEIADKALYRAKQNGRNRVEAALFPVSQLCEE
jgi:diguanylate cyclase (GGDEF)-like protein